MMIGMSISLATGVSSFSVSNAFDVGRCGLITRAPVAAIASVSPSGAAFDAVIKPMVPPAPGWLMTMNWRLRLVLSSAAMMRAIPSAEPPPANGT